MPGIGYTDANVSGMMTWSVTHTESKPRSSAARARPRIRSVEAAGPQLARCTPNRMDVTMAATAVLAGRRAVLELPDDATRGDARRAYRRLAKRTHPDAGGDAAAFAAVAGAFAAVYDDLPAPRPPRRPSPYDWSLR